MSEKNIGKVVGTITENPINEAVNKTVGVLFKELMALENFENVIDDLGELIIKELSNPLFLGIDLQLDLEGKESLAVNLKSYFELVKDKYIKNRNEDKRLQKSLFPIKNNLRSIIDISLGNISEEINRGAVIEGEVVTANCKNNDFNNLELRYSKYGCRVAVPTNGVFISTNCIQLIKEIIEKEVESNK